MNDRLEMIFQQLDILASQFDKIRYEEEIEDYELDERLKPLCDVFNSYVAEFKMPRFTRSISVSRSIYISTQDRESKTLILFNAGKASLATALEAKRRGVNATLFYVKNMDPKFARYAYPQEQAVLNLADRLDMPVVVHKTKMDPKNPLFRARIFNSGIQYAVEQKFSIKLWTGTFDGVSIKNNPFRFFPNSVEFKRLYMELINSVVRDFSIVTPLSSASYMWDVLVSNKGYARYTFSETPFDAVLSYLYNVDYSMIEESEPDLYMKYIEKLRREYIVENGIPPKTIEDLWKRYFFYNIYKSKHYKELMEFLE